MNSANSSEYNDWRIVHDRVETHLRRSSVTVIIIPRHSPTYWLRGHSVPSRNTSDDLCARSPSNLLRYQHLRFGLKRSKCLPLINGNAFGERHPVDGRLGNPATGHSFADYKQKLSFFCVALRRPTTSQHWQQTLAQLSRDLQLPQGHIALIF